MSNHKSPPNVFGFKCQTVGPLDLRLGYSPSQITPQRVWIQMPSRWTTRFETWVVPKPNPPPTCLDSNTKPLAHTIWDLGSPQAKSPSNVFGFKCQTVEPPDLRFEQIWNLKLTSPMCLDSNAKPLDHSIWNLGSPQAKSSINVFGFKCQTIEPPDLRLEQIWSLKLTSPTCLDSNAKSLDHSIWDSGSPQAKSHLNVFGFKCQTVGPPNLRLEQIWSLKLTPPTCLDSNAKPLDHSIWDLGSPQAKSSLNVFGFKCQTVEPPNLRLEQIWSLKLIRQRVWIQMPSRWTTRFETWVVPKPNHPSTCLDSNAKPLNHPIWDLNRFEVPN